MGAADLYEFKETCQLDLASSGNNLKNNTQRALSLKL